MAREYSNVFEVLSKRNTTPVVVYFGQNRWISTEQKGKLVFYYIVLILSLREHYEAAYYLRKLRLKVT